MTLRCVSRRRLQPFILLVGAMLGILLLLATYLTKSNSEADPIRIITALLPFALAALTGAAKTTTV